MGRLPRILLLLLLAVDCLANMVLADGSWKNTLSGDAWKHRQHDYWGWCYRFIDRLPLIGGPDHCKNAAEREAKHGSAWAAWGKAFKAAPWWAKTE